MDFSWSAKQEELFTAIEEFASKELNCDLVERDRGRVFNHDGWRGCGKIVDMKLRLETSRYLLYHGAYQRSLGRSAVMETALAKLHISESWVRT